MDLREALHTAARRHCMERRTHWIEAYRELEASRTATKPLDEVNWQYTNEAYVTFPRYLVWHAILDEVERLETRSAPGTDGLREDLAAAGWRAQTMLTTNPALPPAARAAMAEEREAFARFVRSVSEEQLTAVEPLHLRRVFGKEELQHRWDSLARWNVKKHEYWWPLRGGHGSARCGRVPHGLV